MSLCFFLDYFNIFFDRWFEHLRLANVRVEILYVVVFRRMENGYIVSVKILSYIVSAQVQGNWKGQWW